MTIATIARDLGVAARLGMRALLRRIRSPGPHRETDSLSRWRADLERWLQSMPAGLLAGHRWVELPANRPPWTASGLDLAAGDYVTWFAAGRVHLSRALDIWVPPSFQLWARVAPAGPVLRGTRDTHTWQATTEGPLQLASYFPGEWSTPQGELGHGASDYHKVSGGLVVLLLRWRPGVDPAATLRAAVERKDAPVPVVEECARLAGTVQPPAGWDYLWYLGPGEIYRAGQAPDGQATLCCATHGDVGILRHAVALPLVPGTFLEWRWRVDSLPASLREDSLPSHDYLSIAVEFDDGQDLTYYWSSALPVGTVYRCPLPTWKDKETHVVVRSGTAELGRWLHERRDVEADYRRCIGGTATAVVRVWLIANSLFQRGHGRCEYAAIEFEQPGGRRCKVL